MEDVHNHKNTRDDSGRVLHSEAAWLRAHPGEWAIIAHEHNYQRGLAIQRGQYALLPKGEFKIKQRIQKDRTVLVLGCYVGTQGREA